MDRRLQRRWLIVAAVVVVMLLLAGLAFTALEPPAPKASDNGRPACSPRPCMAPGGFELYLRNLQVAGGRLTMDVSFKNNTAAGNFEAVTYRHTSPVDFDLHYDSGVHKPVIDGSCPGWEEARVERGVNTASGPDRLCFTAPPGGLTGTELRWNPDEGVFPISGSIALDNVPLATVAPSPTTSPTR